MDLISKLAVIGAASSGGTWVMRLYAERRLLDIPNERSSHATPTPRGGGLAIVVTHLSVLLYAFLAGSIDASVWWAIGGGGGLVALVGFVDDHGHVPAALRLVCHLAAICWAVYWLGGLPAVDFGLGAVELGWFGTVMFVLYAAWYLNLYNFIDGIDGIAAVQAMCMCMAGAWLAGRGLGEGASADSALVLLSLAAASAGFLVWNWPPARIFMGDAGSGYIGFALSAMALWTVVEGWLTPWVWLILGGVFLADATVTLMRRARRGERLADAHRSHAYQRLSRRLGGHRPVTLGVLALNLFWCLPWAWAAAHWPGLGALCASAALLPLFLSASLLGAGKPGDIAPGA